MNRYMDQGYSKKEAMKLVAKDRGVGKREIYQQLLEMCIRDRALKGSLSMVGNHSKSAKAEGSLTATPTGGAGTKVGLSDPVV